uniref:Uncharacterized protein n=1 Tax=Spongospora subterranea TaxID=70186 RepID=A0A0H5QIU6_9EUKA|eukprot:CRZ02020.1 hypothetical protein [Spongospora subterranea]
MKFIFPTSTGVNTRSNDEKGANIANLRQFASNSETYILFLCNKQPWQFQTALHVGSTMVSQAHFVLANWSRRSLAAATMLLSAGLTSVYLRVLRPQSGLTQRMLVSRTASILLILSAISSVDGILGEWMSYTPGPMPAPYFTPSRNTERSFSSDLEFSMVITSASMSIIEWMMSLKFE